MPSAKIYGHMDPLEGSKGRETNEALLKSGLLAEPASSRKAQEKSVASSKKAKIEELPVGESIVSSENHRTPQKTDKSRLSPIKAENLTQLPVKNRTKEVINSVQEILGYTELHPEVIAKILDLYHKVELHEERLGAYKDVLDQMEGLSVS